MEYKKEHCDKSGNVLDNNLSKTQLKEIKNLKSRMDKEGLVCGETDKTGKMTLDTLENISKKMEKHIKDDKILNESQETGKLVKQTYDILGKNSKTWRKY